MIFTSWIYQVEEEIGIKLKKEDMVDLTAFLDPSTGYLIFPSPVSLLFLDPSSVFGIPFSY